MSRATIIGDFEWDGHDWLVVLWKSDTDEEEQFEVYRADLPWHWLTQPHDDERIA